MVVSVFTVKRSNKNVIQSHYQITIKLQSLIARCFLSFKRLSCHTDNGKNSDAKSKSFGKSKYVQIKNIKENDFF